MQAQHDRRRRHLRAGVAGGDERVGLSFGLQLAARRPSSCSACRGSPRAGLSVISMTSGASMISMRLAMRAQRRVARLDQQRVELLARRRWCGRRAAGCARDRARRGRAARRLRSPGGRSRPPSRPTRSAPRLGFPGCYSLLTGVVAALGAHVVRPLHRLAARTRLDDDGGRGLVRVAGALLSLGGSSLRDGHGRGELLVVGVRRARYAGENLSRRDVELPQRVPARIGRCRRAVVRPDVEIGPTARTESLAVSRRQSAKAGTASSHCSRSAGRRSSSTAVRRTRTHPDRRASSPPRSAKMMCASSATCAAASPRQRRHSRTTSPRGGRASRTGLGPADESRP